MLLEPLATCFVANPCSTSFQPSITFRLQGLQLCISCRYYLQSTENGYDRKKNPYGAKLTCDLPNLPSHFCSQVRTLSSPGWLKAAGPLLFGNPPAGPPAGPWALQPPPAASKTPAAPRRYCSPSNPYPASSHLHLFLLNFTIVKWDQIWMLCSFRGCFGKQVSFSPRQGCMWPLKAGPKAWLLPSRPLGTPHAARY